MHLTKKAIFTCLLALGLLVLGFGGPSKALLPTASAAPSSGISYFYITPGSNGTSGKGPCINYRTSNAEGSTFWCFNASASSNTNAVFVNSSDNSTITVPYSSPGTGTLKQGGTTKKISIQNTGNFNIKPGGGTNGAKEDLHVKLSIQFDSNGPPSGTLPDATITMSCTDSSDTACQNALGQGTTTVKPSGTSSSKSGGDTFVTANFDTATFKNQIVGSSYKVCATETYMSDIDGIADETYDNTGVCQTHTVAGVSGGDTVILTVGGSATSSADSADCGAGDWNWIICPGTTFLQKVAGQLDDFITSQMTINTSQIFGSSSSAKAYYTAWNTFRIIGTALLVIAGLVMVASEAIGFEILDAYTIRKVLPRLLVAVIFMSLSWPLLEIVVGFFNTVGNDIEQLIYAPFSTIASHAQLTGGLTNWIAIGGIAILLKAGYGGVIFPVLGMGLLTLLLSFFIIVVREVAVALLVILAPFAIAAYVLPNTKKVWDLWKENFLGLMVMFPIVMALIAAGHVFAAIGTSGSTVQQIVGLIAYFIGYFLILFAFRAATGLISTLTGIVNDRSKGAFDRLKNGRSNMVKARHQMHMSDQSKFSQTKLGGAYRRVGNIGTPNSGALGITKGSRAKYAELRKKHLSDLTGEALKADNGRAAGDDDATALAVQHGMTGKKFLQQYEAKRRDSIRQAVQDGKMNEQQATAAAAAAPAEASAALAQIERGFGAQMGTDAMQVAAFKARAASSTAYDGGVSGERQRFNEGGALLNAGLMTEADLVASGKGNRARTDINGAGFSTQMKTFRAAAESLQNGNGGMSAAEASAYLDQTLQEADPGDILAGNTRTVTSMAPAMVRNLTRNIQMRDRAGAAGDHAAYEQYDLQVNRSLGQIAGIQDNLNRTSPQKAAMFANQVNARGVKRQDGSEVTIRQMVDEAANRPPDPRTGAQSFLEVRKEYGSRRMMGPGEEAVANQPPPEPDGQ